ncbi:MAG: class I SAM-dependent methyltransferase [Calditrichaeota bacterium]|nr:class I SAM-dependent methyltransferase [Calditrichota bacterium]
MHIEIFNWLESITGMRQCNSTGEFIYDHMESQSGECLPVIYKEFDPTNRSHFADRAQILDFLMSTSNGSILDFGPGDGWPSLLLAPFVKKVIGVEGSEKRFDVCNRNAKRLSITNAEFRYIPSGTPLPFQDCTFDGAVAASSIEQTPDPFQTLKELFRVLKPGGKLRIHYEDLDRYKDGKQYEYHIFEQNKRTHVIIYNRNFKEESVRQYRLTFNILKSEFEKIDNQTDKSDSSFDLNLAALKRLEGNLEECCFLDTKHPSCKTYTKWMEKIGFNSIRATYDGGGFAAKLFDNLPLSKRPQSIEEVDDLLRPLTRVVVEMDAPLKINPWIVAVK